jgi:hypothetical protein
VTQFTEIPLHYLQESQDEDNYAKNPAEYVSKSYDERAEYYLHEMEQHKKRHDSARTWIIILGAIVTLISSLTTAEFITNTQYLSAIFTIATPILAAAWTILSGLSQSFQWGETWGDMSIYAPLIQKERDRFLTTPPQMRNNQKELEILNELLLNLNQRVTSRLLNRKEENKNNKKNYEA